MFFFLFVFLKVVLNIRAAVLVSFFSSSKNV